MSTREQYDQWALWKFWLFEKLKWVQACRRRKMERSKRIIYRIIDIYIYFFFLGGGVKFRLWIGGKDPISKTDLNLRSRGAVAPTNLKLQQTWQSHRGDRWPDHRHVTCMPGGPSRRRRNTLALGLGPCMLRGGGGGGGAYLPRARKRRHGA